MMMLFLGFTAVSYAQSQIKTDRKEPPNFAQILKEMDSNKDGKLSKDEVKGPLKDGFAKIDLDKDGFISETEFSNAPKQKGREPKFKL